MAQEMIFSANEELPHLNDERYIRFIQEYAANLSHNTHMVLRDKSKGFIACKFSVLSYLLISMVWVDESLPTYQDKLDLLLKINFVKNLSRKNINRLNKKVFNSDYLRNLFMYNCRSSSHVSTEITEWENIRFEDGVAFFGIIDPSYMGDPGEILHYFIVVQRNANGPYTIISSYGSDNVSYYQFETLLQKETFINFIRSLNKDKKDRRDQLRISAYMSHHFLNARFMNIRQQHQKKEAEIKYYLKNKSIMVQFNNIYMDLRGELEYIQGELASSGVSNENALVFDNKNAFNLKFNVAASGFDNKRASKRTRNNNKQQNQKNQKNF